MLVDATLGLGGHAEAFLERFPGLVFVGLDRDPVALSLSGERLARFGDRVHLVHTVYDRIGEVLDDLGIAAVAGVLFDLGVSSMQLDRVERGFSYSKDAPLDMRMDGTSELTAARVLAEYDEAELRRIFYEYGEEKLAPRYARRIVAAARDSSRSRPPPSSSSSSRRRRRPPCSAPATRRSGCSRRCASRSTRSCRCSSAPSRPRSTPSRSADGSSCSRTSRSRTASSSGCCQARSQSTAPRGLPVELPEHAPELKLLVRGAELASDDEKAENPRATPVRLRAAETSASSRMSAVAVAQPLRRARAGRAPGSHRGTSRSRRPAPSAARGPRVVYALVTIAGIGVILLAQLLLSIVLADGAYQISGLQAEQRELLRQEHALTEELQVLELDPEPRRERRGPRDGRERQPGVPRPRDRRRSAAPAPPRAAA